MLMRQLGNNLRLEGGSFWVDPSPYLRGRERGWGLRSLTWSQ